MNKSIYTAAIIGCGNKSKKLTKAAGGFAIGYYHAGAYQSNPRIRLVAGADINADNLTAFQEEFKIDRGYSDYRKMLAEVKPDVVSICTFVGLHREIIEECAKAGVKGILCEKPFVSSPADLSAVQRVVQSTGVKISICHQRRTAPGFQRVRQLYNDGTVGRRVICIAGIKDWDMSEWGSHWLDIFRFFHNDEPVKWVMAQARVREDRGFGHAMEEHAVATFQFANGGTGMVDAGCDITKPDTMLLVGSEGIIRVIGHGADTLRIDSLKGRTEETFENHPWTDGFKHQSEELTEWLDGGSVPVQGLPRTYGSAELNLAVYLSMLRGDRIDLPLDEAALKINEWPLEIIARRYLNSKKVAA